MLLLALATSVPAAGQTEPTHFRVDMHFEQDGERHVMRRYVDGPRSRMEIETDGEKFVVIELGDADHTTYTVIPSMRRVMKSSLPRGQGANAGPADDTQSSNASGEGLELVGTETIDGKSAEKYRVHMPEGPGFVWIDPSNQLPLRMESQGSRVDMRNYDFSRPPVDLFELPKGYEVMDLNQMMKSFTPGRMIAGGIAGSVGGQMAGELGGNIGAGIGGAFGGPVGAMVGRFLGQRLGRTFGQKAGSAIASPN